MAWRIRFLAVSAGLLFGSASVLAPPSAQACTPLPPIRKCPPKRQPAPPVVKIGTPTEVRARSVTLNGTINPKGTATQYYWAYSESEGYLSGSTPTRSLPPGFSTKRVSAQIKDLNPGMSYTITLCASNSTGQVSAARQNAFKTPSHPIILVKLSSEAIVASQDALKVTIRLRGTYDPEVAPKVYVAKFPYRHWLYAGSGSTNTPKSVVEPCPPQSLPGYPCPGLDRNFEVRVKMESTWAQPQTVYVYPYTYLGIIREDYNASPWLDLTYSAYVHRTKDGYPHETVYFYFSSTRKGPWRRVAASRLRGPHPAGDYRQLIAKARVKDAHAVHSFACIRHQLFRDMGQPFVLSKCGAPRLATEPKPANFPF